MGADSKIAWTNHTFNPWWGCQRVSPGCEHCYAEAFDHRLGGSHWGPRAKRRPASEKVWSDPVRWNAAAEKAGVRARVFCASMADVFEDRRDLDAPRARLFALIADTPWLDWLLLTKRPENMRRLAPESWAKAWPSNVWAGTTVEDQRRADERIPHLLRVPAAVRFLSCEPLLGPVDLDLGRCETHDRRFIANDPETNEEFCNECAADGYSGELSFGHWLDALDDDGRPLNPTGIHWVIVGGESGPGARPFDLAWARSIVAQCNAAGVACFVKQLGARPLGDDRDGRAGYTVDRAELGSPLRRALRFTGKGEDPAEWPVDLRWRDFPRGGR